MINSRNLSNVLEQTLRPVSTTSKAILATAITLPNGSILSSRINHSSSTKLDDRKLNLIALFVYQQLLAIRAEAANSGNGRSDSAAGQTTHNYNLESSFVGSLDGLIKFEKIDDGVEVYVRDVENTELKVVIVTEVKYPDGIIDLKINELLKNLKELEQFEYIED